MKRRRLHKYFLPLEYILPLILKGLNFQNTLNMFPSQISLFYLTTCGVEAAITRCLQLICFFLILGVKLTFSSQTADN